MEQYIKKSALVAEMESRIKSLEECFNGKFPMSQSVKETEQDKGKLVAYKSILSLIDTLEVKEVDLGLITGWFDHIAQIADDRMTLTNQRMTDAHALDEIKCLAKNSSEFITKHYKAQKGDNNEL